MWHKIRNYCLAVCIGAVGVGEAMAELGKNDFEAMVVEAQAEFDLVGLAAVLAFQDGRVVGPVASGERVKGSGDLIVQDDAWHIGSNTKMLTALLYGRLAERGVVEWGATLPDLFPHLADEMHTDWLDVTIEDLLAHRSGLAPNPGMLWFVTSRADKRDLTTQREALAEQYLKKPASGVRGEFVYSNLGYILIGAAIEGAVTRAWGENLDFETVFRRVLLDEASANEKWGFGPPAKIQGHGPSLFGGMTPKGTGPGADNPAALGPAGTAHVALEPHARFLSDAFLAPDDPTIDRLLSPYPDQTADYALGIGVLTPTDNGRIYSHSGSNTVFLHRVTIARDAGVVLLIGTNQMSDRTVAAINELERRVLERVLPD